MGAIYGPTNSEGLDRYRRANWKHGWYSATLVEQCREIRKMLRQIRMDHLQLMKEIKEMA
jgi:hypothetical protein